MIIISLFVLVLLLVPCLMFGDALFSLFRPQLQSTISVLANVDDSAVRNAHPREFCLEFVNAGISPACLSLSLCLRSQVAILKVEAGSVVVFIRVGFGGTVSNSASNFQTFLASNPTTAFDVLEQTYGPISVSDISLTFPPPGLPELAIDLTYYLAPLHFFPAGCDIGEKEAADVFMYQSYCMY